MSVSYTNEEAVIEILTISSDVVEILTGEIETIEIATVGPQGIAGSGLPIGGEPYQIIFKLDSQDYNTYWNFIYHNEVYGIDLADEGILYGHINDQSQTIYGIKTFDSFPQVSSGEPLNPYDLSTKKYVDDGLATKDISYDQNFNIVDWTGPSSGFYTIDISHNLNLPIVEVEVWDNGNQIVLVERVLTSNNIVTLRVPASPDLRFSGFIWIKNN